jgi:hypothetical protein
MVEVGADGVAAGQRKNTVLHIPTQHIESKELNKH